MITEAEAYAYHAALALIAAMPMESNEWDAVEKYDEARNIARRALGLSDVYPEEDEA